MKQASVRLIVQRGVSAVLGKWRGAMDNLSSTMAVLGLDRMADFLI
ncbi:hypothetical protein [Paenibacillus sp. PL2-23]